MNTLLAFATWAVCAVAAACFFTAGYLLGLRSTRIDSDSYWQGFADGEAFATTIERTPSPN